MQFSGTMIPDSQKPTIQTIASAGTGAAIHVGRHKKFSISAVDANLTPVPFRLAFGPIEVAATSTHKLFLPGEFVLQTGAGWEYISCYNPNSADIEVSAMLLANS